MRGEMEDISEFGSPWHAGAVTPPEARPSLSFDLDVDVCIVGGGIAGLTVAREMVRRGSSVALLEARRLAWNASGRNGGLVAPGFPTRIEKIVERVGLPTAKELWAQSEAGVTLLRASLAELGVAEEGQGWLDVSKTPGVRLARARIALINEEFRGEVEGWPVERVREALKTQHYYHAVHFPRAFQINPLAYALALAAAAQRAGAHIFEYTPVVTVDPMGIRKRIITAKAQLRASRVVLAGNVQLGAVAPRLADTLVPITRYAGVTRPIGRRILEAIRFKGAVSDSRHANHHYRIVGDDRLLWSGSASFGRGLGPVGRLLLKRRFERAILSIYPELGPVEFESVWPADMGLTIHGMPQIGEVQPGIWLASGFGGHGLHTATLAGHLIAGAICDADDTWRQFLPYELVWAGGRAGRVIMRTISWCEEQTEALTARVARERDARRERRRRIAAGLPAKAPRPAYKVVDAADIQTLSMGEPPRRAVQVPTHEIPTHELPAQSEAAAPVNGPPAEASNATVETSDRSSLESALLVEAPAPVAAPQPAAAVEQQVDPQALSAVGDQPADTLPAPQITQTQADPEAAAGVTEPQVDPRPAATMVEPK
jgi:gamma-glutamylputrescine oxidase